MSLRYAVFPATVKDMQRRSWLTPAHIEAVADRTAEFWNDMSRGRELPVFRVFDWTVLPFTLAMKQRLGQAEIGLRARDTFGRRWGTDTSDRVFDRVVVVLDDGVSNSGVTNPDPVLGAVDLNPALAQHETGHVYQAGHSSLFNPNPPPYSFEYDDRFCIMGRESTKYRFVEPSCVFPDPQTGAPDSTHAWSGPGMSVPWLARAGWLDLSDGVQTRDLTASWNHEGGAEARLAPLHRPGADARDRCVYLERITPDDICVFLEQRTIEGWDRGLPATQGASGHLVAHLSLLDGPGRPASCVQAGSVPARAGAVLDVSGVPVRAEVLEVNADGSLRIRVRRRLVVDDEIHLRGPKIPH